MTHEPDRLVDFPSLATRVFWAGVVVAACAVAGAAVQGLVDGLTFAVLVRWGLVGLLVFVVVAAVIAALHAVGGARRARRRGESLVSDDVGFRPRPARRTAEAGDDGPAADDGRGQRRSLVVTADRQPRTGAWRRERLARSRLYLCTDRRAVQQDLPAFLEAVLAGGVDLVQLRDKEADRHALAAAAAVFRAAANRHGALFVLNDDPVLAAEVDADGVHVGQEDVEPAVARRHVGPERLVGRSTHSHAEIDRALTEDCDYFAIGPVHATPTKKGRPAIGLEPLRHAAAVADRPWFVTGGMAADTIPAARAAGMRRAVVVRALTGADEPGAEARRLSELLRVDGSEGDGVGGAPS